jgi:hypothetical protein
MQEATVVQQLLAPREIRFLDFEVGKTGLERRSEKFEV